MSIKIIRILIIKGTLETRFSINLGKEAYFKNSFNELVKYMMGLLKKD